MERKPKTEKLESAGNLEVRVGAPELMGYFKLNPRAMRVVNKQAGLYEGVVVFKNNYGQNKRIGYRAFFNHDYTIKTAQFKPNLNSEGEMWDYQNFGKFGGKVVRSVIPYTEDINSYFSQHVIDYVIEYFQDIFEKNRQEWQSKTQSHVDEK